jgi:PEP-CTERM motif
MKMARDLLRKLLAISVLGFAASSAQAIVIVSTGSDYTFNFTGQCEDCGDIGDGFFGLGIATGVVALTNYNLGADLLLSNLVSFTYTSDKLGTLVADLSDATVFGRFDSEDPATADFAINFVNAGQMYQFISCGSEPLAECADGEWAVFIDAENNDFGNSHTFSTATDATIPEPTTLALLGMGFAGVGFCRRQARAISL